MSVSPQRFSDTEPDDKNSLQLASNSNATPPAPLSAAAADDDHFGDLIGHTIGHYLVEARLGGGAMASVYRALDQIQKRTVALKVLLPGADNVIRERFRLEARTVSTLAHPNIVSTLQIGQTAAHSITYIAMELVEGSGLAELVEQKRQLSVVDSCKLLEPIARALAYAHDNAVIHRDVKPSNILLRRVDVDNPNNVQISILNFPVVPLLSDFGIARSLDAPELTSAGRTIGTPAYMAPEQCAGSRQIDGRADIYALGTVLYRCVVGRPPFVGTTTQILHAHVYDPVTMPQEMVAKLPPLIVEILKKTLAKEPENRYQNAGLLADDLAVAARLPEQPVLLPDERTATMATLPVVRPLPTTSQVLVPAYMAKGSPATTNAPEAGALKPVFERDKLPTGAAVRPAPKRRERTNWAGVLFGSLLALLPLVVGLVVIASLIPWNGLISRWVNPPEPAVITVSTATPPPPTLLATTTYVPTLVPNSATAGLTTSVAVATPVITLTNALSSAVTSTVASAVTNTVDVTGPVAISTPAISVPAWWDDAQSLYASRDWKSTRDKLIVILRTDVAFSKALATHQAPEGELIARLFFGNPPAAFWEQQRGTINDKERLREMLFNAYVGMATVADASKNAKAALDFFNDAFALRPTNLTIKRLRDATEKYITAADETKKQAALLALAQTHNDFADELGAQGEACGALEQLTAAATLAPDSKPKQPASKYTAVCKSILQVTDRTDQLKQFNGALLYSTYEDREYRIYRVPLTNTFALKLLAVNSTQPRLSPDGKMLAFHSTPPESEGMSGLALDQGLAPTDRSVRYATFVEDGKESPADWNPAGDYIIFASRREYDRQSRMYIQSTVNNQFNWFYGEDPTWQPSAGGGNQIVYRGTDLTGNQLGLWQATSSGEGAAPLTNVSGDRRPTWSPDGKYLVFMSDTRDGNWEIYRLTFADPNHPVIRLTNDPGQDGLPTVSPDGKYVAFVSNRGGLWQIWAVPIDGGEAIALAPIQGSLTHGNSSDWLEHAIQWVK